MGKNSLIVLDLGSQFNQLIVRRVREWGVYCELSSPETIEQDMKRLDVSGIIISGSPSSLYEEDAPRIPGAVLSSGLPILGICYGLQLLAHQLGGEVTRGEVGEFGFQTVWLDTSDPLMEGLPPQGQCWMSHRDKVVTLPPGAKILAHTESIPVAALRLDSMYGVQFHPEVSHTTFGKNLIKNFLKICGCDFSWTAMAFAQEAEKMIREKVGSGSAICAVSGGIDSTVAAVIAHRALGERLHCVFVDNGLLRGGEAEEVGRALRNLLIGSNLHLVDASHRFVRALEGVVDPEQKRKIIGEVFIRVFEDVAGKIPDLNYLIQGTLYPDVIESRGSSHKYASRIKTHHNVGGLPENLSLTIVEPLRLMFKDEVRRLGSELGVAGFLLKRQPFPGPGLAVRIIGEVTEPHLTILRAADTIVTEEIEKAGGMVPPDLWQYFAVFVPLKTVGVMGDRRTYSNQIALRVVSSEDGMTCDWVKLPWELLNRISLRIVNEVSGINRVVYDITSKPPATIEWE